MYRQTIRLFDRFVLRAVQTEFVDATKARRGEDSRQQRGRARHRCASNAMAARAAAAAGGRQSVPGRATGTLGAWGLCGAHGARGARRARAKRRALPAETICGAAGAGRRWHARGACGRATGNVGAPREPMQWARRAMPAVPFACARGGQHSTWLCRALAPVCARGARVSESPRARVRATAGVRVRVRGQATCRSLRRGAAGSPGHAVAKPVSRAAASSFCFAARSGWQCVCVAAGMPQQVSACTTGQDAEAAGLQVGTTARQDHADAERCQP